VAEHPSFSEFINTCIPSYMHSDIREGITEYLTMQALGKQQTSDEYGNQTKMIATIVAALSNGNQRLMEAYWYGNVEAFLPIMQEIDLPTATLDEETQQQIIDLGEHGKFLLGEADGDGLNCLIDAIGKALGTPPTVTERRRIRAALINLGLAQQGQFLWNDQQVLSAILQGLGENPNTTSIYFVDNQNQVDDQTYANHGQVIYIFNHQNVHFSPLHLLPD
ncbi:MAG: hypothetical protein F6K42_23465, partial [Leptolyngbya sp. SIO1D8]|nr:hypothetical protein [Leptolyngbya sp. SIO1D8]